MGPAFLAPVLRMPEVRHFNRDRNAKGYLIGLIKVTDPEQYAVYAKASSDVIEQFGGKPVVQPGTAIIAEGSPRPRTVIFEFDSFETVQRFWESADYNLTKTLRANAADCDFILMEGIS